MQVEPGEHVGAVERHGRVAAPRSCIRVAPPRAAGAKHTTSIRGAVEFDRLEHERTIEAYERQVEAWIGLRRELHVDEAGSRGDSWREERRRAELRRAQFHTGALHHELVAGGRIGEAILRNDGDGADAQHRHVGVDEDAHAVGDVAQIRAAQGIVRDHRVNGADVVTARACPRGDLIADQVRDLTDDDERGPLASHLGERVPLLVAVVHAGHVQAIVVALEQCRELIPRVVERLERRGLGAGVGVVASRRVDPELHRLLAECLLERLDLRCRHEPVVVDGG